MRTYLLRTLAAVLAIAGMLPAQTVRVTNIGGDQRRWVPVSIPKSKAISLAPFMRCESENGESAIAIRGRDIGTEATQYHLFVDQPAGSSWVWKLQDPIKSPPFAKFAPTVSVADAPFELRPQLVVYIEDDATHEVSEIRPQLNDIKVVEENPARNVVSLRTVPVEGFMYEGWVYPHSFQDVVPFEILVTWSDRDDPRWARQVRGIALEFGEYPLVDYRVRHGWPEPFEKDGKWVQIIAGEQPVGDGEQIAVTGSMFCVSSFNPLKPGAQPVLRNLLGGLQGPLLATSLDWAGEWLAYDTVPMQPADRDGWADANAAHAGFVNSLQNTVGYYAQRPISLAQTAGQTGDQVPFGASKGSYAVTVGDPRWIYAARYSETLHLRGFHHRERDGSRLLFENHPTWRTWSQYTDHRNVLDDAGMLGKPRAYRPYSLAFGPHRWGGIDDQHRMDTHDVASYALTGSYMLENVLIDAVETDRAQVPNRIGAARAVGRLYTTWSHYYTLLSGRAKEQLAIRMAQRKQDVLNGWRGRHYEQGQVRTLSTERGANVIRDPQGNEYQAWVVWQEAIGARGLYGAWKVTGDEDYMMLARAVAETVTLHGFYFDGTSWKVCAAVRSFGVSPPEEGIPIPPENYGMPGWTSDGGSFSSWILPAVVVCQELTNDPEIHARASTILHAFRPNGPTSWRDSEWFAVR